MSQRAIAHTSLVLLASVGIFGIGIGFLEEISIVDEVTAQSEGSGGVMFQLNLPLALADAPKSALEDARPARVCSVTRLHFQGEREAPGKVIQYRLRSDGQVTERSSGGAPSGGARYRSRWSYDSTGRVLLYWRARDGDGEVESSIRYSYDGYGYLKERRGDDEADGEANWAWKFVHRPDGKLLQSKYVDLVRDKTTQITDYLFDNEGRITEVRYDFDGNGIVEAVLALEWLGGLHMRTVVDSDNDGEPDAFILFEYDSEGRETLWLSDTDADGEVEHSRSKEYDSLGRLMRWNAYEGDEWRAGESFEYDDDGRVVVSNYRAIGSLGERVESHFEHCSGVPDVIEPLE